MCKSKREREIEEQEKKKENRRRKGVGEGTAYITTMIEKVMHTNIIKPADKFNVI